MTRIFLVRHGETEWNSTMRYQGHADIPLSEAGINQAQKLSERLHNEKIDAFYASDLSRALVTAQTVAEAHGEQVQLVPELRETNFGSWEGLTYKEIIAKYPEDMHKWQTNPLQSKIPGGESLSEVAERVSRGFRKIVVNHPDQQVLVAAHGGTIRVILAGILEMPLQNYWKLRQDNTALNIIDFYEEKAIVFTINDVNHLR